MGFLVFGSGRVWQQRYRPAFEQMSGSSFPEGALQVTLVEGETTAERRARVDAFVAEAGGGPPGKVLILSLPQSHLRDLQTILDACVACGVRLPEVFIEKPLYLQGERPAWERLLAEQPILRERARYIDHYRYKEPVRFLVNQKDRLLMRLGPLREVAWVSLEAQPFWDSLAFADGYLLEHGCHCVSMLRQVFGDSVLRSLVPRRRTDWKAWVQKGRPLCCGEESAAVLYLTGAPGSALDGVEVTVALGKALVDRKYLRLVGERGSLVVWFNEGRLDLRTAEGREQLVLPAPTSHLGVVRDILGLGQSGGELLGLEDALAEQEMVVALSRQLREQATTEMSSYEPGEVPAELEAELGRIET